MAKNRTWEKVEKNGKFFCWHDWECVESKVGPSWDLVMGLSLLSRCKKCGKVSFVRNYRLSEVPDELICDGIRYM